MVRILIIDDSMIFANAIAKFLRQFEHVDVVAIATTANEGLAAVEKLQPDLALIDVHLPQPIGFAVAKYAMELHRGLHTIIVSTDHEANYHARALQAGAERFISKDHLVTELPPLLVTLSGKSNHE